MLSKAIFQVSVVNNKAEVVQVHLFNKQLKHFLHYVCCQIRVRHIEVIYEQENCVQTHFNNLDRFNAIHHYYNLEDSLLLN